MSATNSTQPTPRSSAPTSTSRRLTAATTEIDFVVRGAEGGSQVRITDADGSVVLDVHVPEGDLVGLEVKNGPDARESDAQIARFPQVRESGGTVSRVDDGSPLGVGQRLPGFDIHIVRINVPVSSS